jgi:hypothetical protein
MSPVRQNFWAFNISQVLLGSEIGSCASFVGNLAELVRPLGQEKTGSAFQEPGEV